MEAGSAERNSLTENNRLPIQNYFIGWQCRVREFALRNEEGRPNEGMRPQIELKNGEVVFPAATLLIIPDHPDQTIRQFRFMALKTQDPKERHSKACNCLQPSFIRMRKISAELCQGFFPDLQKKWKNLRNISTAL